MDANQVLKGIRKSNIVKLVFGQLNKNSLRNKFDTLSEMIKDFVDVFMTPETKLYDSFPGCQFFIEGYHTPPGLIKMERVMAFYSISARTYQLKSSIVTFQHMKAFMLKLIFLRKMAVKLFL